jgi:hypothetical protein
MERLPFVFPTLASCNASTTSTASGSPRLYDTTYDAMMCVHRVNQGRPPIDKPIEHGSNDARHPARISQPVVSTMRPGGGGSKNGASTLKHDGLRQED